jgi:hypothetical protein
MGGTSMHEHHNQEGVFLAAAEHRRTQHVIEPADARTCVRLQPRSRIVFDPSASTASKGPPSNPKLLYSYDQGPTLLHLRGQHSPAIGAPQGTGVAAAVPTREIRKAAMIAKRMAMLKLDGLVGEGSCVADIPCAALINISLSPLIAAFHMLCARGSHIIHDCPRRSAYPVQQTPSAADSGNESLGDDPVGQYLSTTNSARTDPRPDG